MKHNDQLARIFEDTVERSQKFAKGKTSKHTFEEIKFEKSAKIEVLNMDTVSAATLYASTSLCAVLNMASAKRPGGGVKNGAKAQEEGLFRCSNLHHLISEDLYPLKEDECIYTEDVIFFKDAHYNLMDPITVDVITMPAVNLNSANVKEMSIADYQALTKNKIRLMLSLAIQHNIQTLILGAWGCGVFKNDPSTIASLFQQVLTENYTNHFDKIVFAIINDHNSVGSNYEIFKKTFSN